MLLSPIFMGVSCALITWKPTVAMLSFRRFLMPLSSTPWHVGESVSLSSQAILHASSSM